MGNSGGAPTGMSLRLVWGGPWNQQSVAARASLAIVEELAVRGHVIEVLRTEIRRAAKLAPLSSAVTVRFWNEVSIADVIRSADAIIVNVGDDYDLYGGMLGDFLQLGAVTIFYNSLLSNLAYGWAITSAPRKETDFFASAFQALTHPRPILEWFASGSVGAVLRDRHDFDCVRAVCPGPVAVIPYLSEGDQNVASRYVDTLLPLLAAAISERPVLLAARALGSTLGAIGVDADDPAIERVGRAFDSLFASHEKASE